MSESIHLDAYVESEIVGDVPNNIEQDPYVLSDYELNVLIPEVEKQILEGRVKPAEQVFAELSREFNSWITR
ncbi:MAG: hypothetical protein LUG60_00190 [Erysipelotrichaceae bacterium]|nr:hypothetical protein [Erysipelotrichaceae bacterium]